MSFSHQCCQHHETADRFISDQMKLRSRTKFLIGTCAVHVLFTESAGNQWDINRKNAFLAKVDGGLARLRGLPRKSNPAQNLGSISFLRNAGEQTTSQSPWNPLEGCPNNNNDKLQRNIRHFLKEKGFYRGPTDRVVQGYNDPELKQSLWEFNNDQRDRLNTDWAMLIVVVPNPGAGAPDCGWASQELGIVVMSEYPSDVENVIAHETSHLFGPLDEYKGGPVNTPAGLYNVPNVNVDTPASVGCLMRERKALHVCEVTWNQLGLQQNSAGGWVAVNDRAFQQYEMNDNGFRYEGGIILTSGMIRRGGALTVEVSGQSKMHPLYNPHGPDGDAGTIVGSDHLVPNQPFSCVIGRWLSLDGKQSSGWFRVGSSSTHVAPFPAYFVFNVNDKKGNFSDNSGQMTIKLTAKLRDHLGEPWVRALRAAEVDTTGEAEASITRLLLTQAERLEEAVTE